MTDALYSRTGHQHHQRCWGTATSGVPPNTPLFNGSICGYIPHTDALLVGTYWLNFVSIYIIKVKRACA